jgi:uncharacterized protein with von Willebrand factor type A (vWA) domain
MPDLAAGVAALARGAVVVILSDGWETGDASEVGREMERLARLAHRIVWVNPRAADPRFATLAGGMAAALPHVSRLVSGHSAAALAAVVEAIAEPDDAPVRRIRACASRTAWASQSLLKYA